MIDFSQGILGWYMVKSGLAQALLEQPGAVPRVSQYRLTAHLATALTIYTATLMVGAGILRDTKVAAGTYPKVKRIVKNMRERIFTHA